MPTPTVTASATAPTTRTTTTSRTSWSARAASPPAASPSTTTRNPPGAHPLESFTNAFNPCLPHAWSRTCKRIVPFSSAWAPFNPEDTYWYILN